MPPPLQLTAVFKRFGSVRALDGADFEVRQGEIHALLGENGAGKTTLMNVVCGLIKADDGVVSMRGEPVDIHSPSEAFQRGVGMVHQDFRLVEALSVAENIHLGWTDAPKLLSSTTLRNRTSDLIQRHGFQVEADALVRDLSVGERQRVAILRAVARGARTLILDEPTAVLTPQEAEGLFDALRAMTASGGSVVFISHKLREVLAVANRVTVLRRGVRVATLDRSECDAPTLARHMVGHEVVPEQYSSGRPGKPILSARGVVANSVDGRPALKDVTFDVRRGEILGLAGVAGNGQVALAGVLTGLRPVVAGSIVINGQDLTGARPMDFIRGGVGHITDQHRVGLALEETLTVNAIMKDANAFPIRRGPFLSWSHIKTAARSLLLKAGLADLGPRRLAATLSGGQKQRLLVYREIASAKTVLVALHPTNGLDIAAAGQVHELLREARSTGVGVLLISEDLDEILVLSDRVAVIYEGAIVGNLERREATRERIGELMGGHGRPLPEDD